MAGMSEPKPTEGPYTEAERRLLQRAQAGDPAVLSELRELLGSRPELWRRLGDLAGHVEEVLVGLAAGRSLLARESVRRRMDELRAELAGPAPSPVEKLLVGRAVVCWAQCHRTARQQLLDGRRRRPLQLGPQLVQAPPDRLPGQ